MTPRDVIAPLFHSAFVVCVVGLSTLQFSYCCLKPEMPKRKTRGRSTAAGKKGDESKRVKKMDLEAYRTYARNQAAASIRDGDNGDDLDMDHLFLTTRALIVTNQEIWDRCQGSKVKGLPPPSVVGYMFRRVSYTQVNVETSREIYNAVAHEDMHNIELIAIPKIEGKEFGPPASPPASLTQLISAPKCADGDLPDYTQYLEKAMTLHDEVLRPFLARLKDHLETVQVYLGSIDVWLMDAASCISYLEETFKGDGVKIEIPQPFELGDYGGCPPNCKVRHPRASKCLYCGEEFSEHDGHGCCINERTGEFEMEVELKRVTVPGEHRMSFDITKENDKTRLKKFLDFICA